MVRTLLLSLLLLGGAAPAQGAEWLHERGPATEMPQVQLVYPQQGVYQRGQAIILYHIDSNSRVLNLRYPELQLEQAESYRIPQTVTQLGPQRYRHTLGWTVHPLVAGPLLVSLPDVAYVQSGVVNYRLHSAPITLNVLPLPGYLPRQMPVGSIEMAEVDPPLWLRVGDEVYLQLVITTHGIADSLYRPPPPTLLETEQGNAKVQLQAVDTVVDAQGLHTRYRYLVPLTVTHSGLLRYSQTLQWFDPQQGRLQQQVFRMPPIVLLADWQLYPLLLLTAALLAWIVWQWWCRLRYRWHQLQVYRQLLAQLPQLQQHAQLRVILDQIAQTEGLLKGLSLARLIPQLCRDDSQARILLPKLQQVLYGDGDMVDVPGLLRRLIQARLGYWRIFLPGLTEK